MPPRPFTIDVPEAVLRDLRERLARTRWPDEPPDAGWRHGASLAYVQALCQYWREGYDWRVHEAALNRFPQFTADVAIFPKEILTPPRAWAERAFNLTRVTSIPAGGHFAALEEPAALAADLRAFFRTFRR